MIIKALLVKLGADMSDVKKKFRDIEKTVEQNRSKIQGSLNKLSLAVGGIGLGAVKMSTDFNKSMANIAALIPGNIGRVQTLKSAVQEMAIETGKGTGDIADGLYNIVSAFGDSADSAELLEVNVKAAAAGMATTTDAINLTSAVTKGYGDVSAEATKKAADLAFMTVKLGQTNFPQLAGSIGDVVPMADALNVSQEELFATFVTLTGVTGDASKVATQFSGILGAIIKPTENMQAAIEKLGFASGEAMIDELGFMESLQKLAAQTDGTTKGLGELISRKEGLTGALALLGSQTDTYNTKLGQMEVASGSMLEAYGEMTDGINKSGFEFEKAKQKIAVLMQTLGDQLAPALADVVEAMEPLFKLVINLIKGFSNLPKPIKTVVLAFGGLLAVSGPLFKILWSIKKLLPLMGKGFGKLKAGMGGLLGKATAVTAAFGAGMGIGKLIRQIPGVDKKIQGLITSLFGLEKRYAGVAAQFGKGHETAAARRMEILGKASEIAGKKITSIQDAARILKTEFEKSGTTGSKVADTFVEKFGAASTAAGTLKKGVTGIKDETDKGRKPLVAFGKAAEDLGFTLKSQIEAELRNTEAALLKYKKANELTPAEIKRVEEKVKDLKVELGLLNEKTESWSDIMKKKGVKTITEVNKAISDQQSFMNKLVLSYNNGDISLKEFDKQMKIAKKDMDDLKGVSKGWIDFLNSKGIKTVKQKEERIEELDDIMKDLTKQYELGELELKDYEKAMKSAEKETRELKGETESWADILKKKNIKTVKEKQKAIKELRSFMAKLKTDFKTGKIDLQEYQRGMSDAKDEMSELTGETNELGDALEDAVSGIKEEFISTFSEMLQGTVSFKEGLKGIWESIKKSFFDLVAQMAVKWAVGLVSGSGTGGLFGSISGSFLGNIGKMVGPVGIGLLAAKLIGFENIKKTVQDIWKGISDIVVDAINIIGDTLEAIGETTVKIFEGVGSVIQSTFQAASSIIGGIGSAIGGIFKGIGKLFGGDGKKKGQYSEITFWLKPILVEAEQIRAFTFSIMNILLNQSVILQAMADRLSKIPDLRDKLSTLNQHTVTIKSRLTELVSTNKMITNHLGNLNNKGNKIILGLSKLVESISGAPSFAQGGHVDGKQLAFVGEVPETIIPDSDLRSALENIPRGGSINLFLAKEINALDGQSIIDTWNKRLAPVMLEWIKTNAGKTALRGALL
jgi:TP901 family phage tail tape measure protein